jgi:hypothetical protein
MFHRSAPPLQQGGSDSRTVLGDLSSKLTALSKLDEIVRTAGRTERDRPRALTAALTHVRGVADVEGATWLEGAFKSSWNDLRNELSAAKADLDTQMPKFKSLHKNLLMQSAARSSLGTVPTMADVRAMRNDMDMAQRNADDLPAKISQYNNWVTRARSPGSRGFPSSSDPYTSLKHGIDTIITSLYQFKSPHGVLKRLAQFTEDTSPHTDLTDLELALMEFKRNAQHAHDSTSQITFPPPEGMQGIKRMVDTLVEKAADKIAKESAKDAKSSSINPKAQDSEEELVRYCEMLQPPQDLVDADALLSAATMATLKDTLMILSVYSRLAPAMREPMSKSLTVVRAWISKHPTPTPGAPMRNPQQAAEEQRSASMRGTAVSIERALVDLEAKIGFAATDPTKPQAMAILIKLLDSADTVTALSGLSSTRGAAGSGYGSSSSSPSSPFDSRTGPLPGFLFRQVAPLRVVRYNEQIQRFRDSLTDHPITSHVASQVARLQASLEDLIRQAAAVSSRVGDDGAAADHGSTMLALRRLGDAKVEAAKSFARSVRSTVRAYVAVHFSFVGKHHADAMRYMAYWKGILETDPEFIRNKDVIRALDEHAETRKELSSLTRERLLEDVLKRQLYVVRDEKLLPAGSLAEPRLNETQMSAVEFTIYQLTSWVLEQTEVVEELYLRGGLTISQEVFSPQTIVLYTLKAMRLLAVWFTLLIATRTFQNYYADRVYTRDEAPPSPALFVLLIVALDAAMQAVFLVVLAVVMRALKTHDNDFPIDVALLSAWSVDALASTAAVALVALVIGEVIKSKKYFRYKYEGERGIRAMREMVYYVYCVMVPVPFYKLVQG